MFDSMDICKSLNINIGTVMKNPETLKFFLLILKLTSKFEWLLDNIIIERIISASILAKFSF